MVFMLNRGLVSGIFVVALFCSLSLYAKDNLKKGMNSIKVPKKYNGAVANQAIPVDIFVPKGEIKAILLVLPGWNFSRKRWYKETDLLKFAQENGFCCVFPEMGKSNYESKFFKESYPRPLWKKKIPGGLWVSQILLPYLQNEYFFMKKKCNNFMLGLSTGARGVALVSLQNPGIFKGGVALSGDYNQLEMPHDGLMTRAYGSSRKFRTRWATVDNPAVDSKNGKWKMPVYIGHGTKDKTSPYIQSQKFYNILKKKYPKLNIKFHSAKGSGHNFKYWNSELPNAFKFFVDLIR